MAVSPHPVPGMFQMFLCLHVPSNFAHLEDLKDRLIGALASAPHAAQPLPRNPAQVETLADVVRAMDNGALTTGQALDIFAQHQLPGFDLERWLAEIMDEGVYLEVHLREAA